MSRPDVSPGFTTLISVQATARVVPVAARRRRGSIDCHEDAELRRRDFVLVDEDAGTGGRAAGRRRGEHPRSMGRSGGYGEQRGGEDETSVAGHGTLLHEGGRRTYSCTACAGRAVPRITSAP